MQREANVDGMSHRNRHTSDFTLEILGDCMGERFIMMCCHCISVKTREHAEPGRGNLCVSMWWKANSKSFFLGVSTSKNHSIRATTGEVWVSLWRLYFELETCIPDVWKVLYHKHPLRSLPLLAYCSLKENWPVAETQLCCTLYTFCTIFFSFFSFQSKQK